MIEDRDELWIREQFLKSFDTSSFHILAKDGVIGSRERDIVILDRDNGLLLVLEAKRWSTEILVGIEATPEKWELKYLGWKTNPQKQADQELVSVLKKLTPEMKNQINYMSGVIFTSIASAKKDICHVLKNLDPAGFVLWADAFGENLEKIYNQEIDRVYAKRGWKSRKSFRGKNKAFGEIIKKIDPTVNIPRREVENKETETQKVEKLVGRIQYGHHRVNGVVGSGKTFFLAHKLKELVNKYLYETRDLLINEPKILVLTMTRTCKSKILKTCTEIMNETELAMVDELIRFETFAAFLMREYKLPQPKIGGGAELENIERLRKFEGVIIDEFQDFQQWWAPFIYRHVNRSGKDEGLFLLLFDPAQAKPAHIATLFQELEQKFNLQWASREHYLKVCYRLPDRIGRFAINGYKAFYGVELEEAKDETITKVITRSLKPEFHENGGSVEFVEFADTEDEASNIAIFLNRQIREKGWMPKDIALVIPPDKPGVHKAFDLFQKIKEAEPGIRYLFLDNRGNSGGDGDNRDHFYKRGDVVSVISPMRFKGLELPYVVCTPSVTKYFLTNKTSGAFYQAVTRALDTVVLVASESQLKSFKPLRGS